MAAVSQPTIAPAGVVFELERLELDDGRLVVTGWWSGVRGMRFVRPTLVIGDRQVLATLEHKPWAPHGDGLWIAAFPWPHGKVDPGEVSLAVTPRVTVPVLPGAPVEVVPDEEPEAAEGEAASAQDETQATPHEAHATRHEAQAAPDVGPAPSPAAPPAGPDSEELRRAQAAAARERDGAVAQRDEAVHDREAALRTRRRMEAQRDEALQKREATETQLERALAERDEARASRDRAVRDREAAERARHTAEAEVDGVLRRVEAERAESRRDRESAEAERHRATAERDEAIAERDEARARRDDVLLAHHALRRQVDALRADDARGDAAPAADPEPEREEPRGPDDPIGVREIPAARSVAAELGRGQRDRDRARDVSRFDLWAIRILGSIAATCFILLLVMVLRVFV